MACYLLTDCKNIKPQIVVSNNLSAYLLPVGTTITISTLGATCWLVTTALTCEEAVTLPDTIIIKTYQNCAACSFIFTGQNGSLEGDNGGFLPLQTCYLLTDCNTTNPQAPIVITNNYLAYVGSVVKISTLNGGVTCWQVTASENCIGAISLDDESIVSIFSTCLVCNPPLIPICYRLTDCTGVTPSILVNTDLSSIIGLVINNVVTLSGPVVPSITCWTVTLFGPSSSGISLISYNVNAFENCACCLPQPVPPPIVLPPRIIPDPVVDYYRVTMSPCEIDTTINFCESYWNLTKKLRFGITTCEWNKDSTQLWVEQQLVQLQNSFNPLYCIEGDNNPPPFQQNPCSQCAPNPCSCGRNPQRPLGKCGCHTIFAGVPCREHEVPQTYILWSDLGILNWSCENPLLNE